MVYRLRVRFALLAVVVLLMVSVGVSHAAAGNSVLVGAFDVGPMGAPESFPYYNTAGNAWLMKIWSPLVSLDADCSGLYPQLAVKWESNSDATIWTFYLRKGVKWHDGKPFTANDVKFTFELATHPAAAAAPINVGFASDLVGYDKFAANETKNISGIKVVDNYTIRFQTTKSSPRFPYQLCSAYILPEHVFRDVAPSQLKTTDWWGKKAIGTGPFKFSKHVSGQYMELVANSDYWAGKPKIDRLINRYFADPAAAVLALERGDIDFTYIEGDAAARLSTDKRFQVYSGPSGVTNYLIFNHRNPIFRDKRVREAFYYAIDRKAIVDQVFQGGAYVVPCLAPYPSMWPSESSINKYEYNPEKARKLLAEAGWDSKYTFEVWTYYSAQMQKDALQAIQAYLADVGVRMVPRFMDVPAYNAQFYSGKGWDVSYRGLACNVAAYPFEYYRSDGYPAAEGKSLSGYKNSELDALLDKASVEMQQDRYMSLLKEIGRFQNKEAIDVYLWTATRYAAASARVKGMQWYPAPGHLTYEDHPEAWYIE